MLLSDVTMHRQQLTAITGRAVSDATVYARSVADESPEKVAAQVREASAAVVAAYAPVAAEGAALFYETQRPQPGTARVAAPSIGAALAEDLSWAFLPLFTPEKFPDPLGSLLSNIGGTIQRHVALADRETMLLSSDNDPLSEGVRRFARPGACAFCAYLTSVVEIVDDDVIWHRNCHCVSVPWWEDNPLPHDPNVEKWAELAGQARKVIEDRRAELIGEFSSHGEMFRAHPELTLTTKNLTRLMRKLGEFAH